MLYYNFKNYEEFKELFGIVEHGNGVKSRKNKIMLALWKDRNALRQHIRCREFSSLNDMCIHFSNRDRHFTRKGDWNKHRGRMSLAYSEADKRRDGYSVLDSFTSLLDCSSLTCLKVLLLGLLGSSSLRKDGCRHRLRLNGHTFYSDLYETDDMEGLCEDGTLNAIRYRNIEKSRMFKMKAGKMFNHILSCNVVTDALPEQIKRWLSEEWVADWIEYARENIAETDFELHVDDNFEAIYDCESCAGYDEDSDSFHSCMVNDGQWTFYRDAVDAKAAYLTGNDGLIYARCVLFTEVHEKGSDKIWRLAERQYSKFQDLSLQRQLVNALIRGGHIDGYKKVGASCSDNHGFVDNEGNSLEDKRFYISCRLHDGDTLSYQDSFKWYDEDVEVADNYGNGEANLDTTDSEFCGHDNHDRERWSEYNQEWIDEDYARYVETREDYFHEHQVSRAMVWNSRSLTFRRDYCFYDDCVEINGEYYYAGTDAEDPEGWGISVCPECDEYFIVDEGCYSELTDEDYCCESCMNDAEERYKKDNGWVLSQYDSKWYEDADEVITARWWRKLFNRYEDCTISVESFNGLVEDGEATEYCGAYYIDDVSLDGEPVHLLAESFVAA